MKKNGFTLVELLAVIAILAIILLIAIPQVTSTMQKSSVEEEKAFKKDIELAAQTYVEENWTKQEFKTQIVINPCIPVQDLINNGYLSTIIKNPENPDENVAEQFVKLTNQSTDGNYRFKYEYTNSCS